MEPLLVWWLKTVRMKDASIVGKFLSERGEKTVKRTDLKERQMQKQTVWSGPN